MSRALLAPLLLILPTAAHAHGEIDLDRTRWTWWQFSPKIIFDLLFAGWLYGRGNVLHAAAGEQGKCR